MAAEKSPPTATDPGSLQNLQDIVVPEPISWWPLAPGWYVLIAIATVLSIYIGYRALHRWRKNLYRRTALKEIEKLETGESSVLPSQLASLLKRVAVTAYPRAEVASLNGSTWLAFLDQTGSTDAFTKGVGHVLGAQQYQKPSETGASPDQRKNLLDAVRHWIRNHQLETEGTQNG